MPNMLLTFKIQPVNTSGEFLDDNKIGSSQTHTGKRRLLTHKGFICSSADREKFFEAGQGVRSFVPQESDVFGSLLHALCMLPRFLGQIQKRALEPT